MSAREKYRADGRVRERRRANAARYYAEAGDYVRARMRQRHHANRDAELERMRARYRASREAA